MTRHTSGQLLARLEGKRVVICVGSGGVGKTTVSAALALGLAMRGRKVAVVTIDPAKRLAAALGLDELASAPHRIDPELLGKHGVAAKGELWAMMLDAKRTLDEIVTRLEPDAKRLEAILENPVYKELSTAVAGSHELSAIAKLYELHEEHDFDTIVLDTPPSRNALDFLNAPTRLLGFLEGRALQVFLAPSGLTARLFGRGTGIVFAIFARVTGIDMLGELSRFFGSLTGVIDSFGAQTRGVAELLREEWTAFAIVTSPEPEPAREAVFLAERLTEAGMARGALIVNRVSSEGLHGQEPAQVATLLEPELGERLAARVAANLADFDVLARRDAATVRRLSHELDEPAPVQVPQLDEDVQDLAGLARVAGHLLG
ncbi:MAG TPA: ArsA-related P-loop ATPase [Solirubrobacteraceae bacterium]|nr:ArsA-related P-loop ATPase [Solirubrobacteraceae bacterium]